MFTYADPEACPICRSRIPYAAVECPECGTELSGTLAAVLWRTLTHADGLVTDILRLAEGSTEARTAAGSVPSPTPEATGEPFTFDPFPSRAGGPDPRRSSGHASDHFPGLTSASVPKVLLTLGAGCLLVAAIVFLVVAWTSFGQTGRTLSLLAVTTAAAGSAYWMTRRGLRAGAESLGTVVLGLLVLDVYGADSAEWFGDLGTGSLALLLGTVVAVCGLLTAHVVRRGHSLSRLVCAEAFGAVGVLVATIRIGTADSSIAYVVAATALLLVGLTLATRQLDLSVSAGILLVGAAGWWWGLVSVAGAELGSSLVSVWGGLDFLPMLIAASIMLIPLGLSVPRPAQVGGVAIAVTLVGVVLTLPVLDESVTARTLTSLAVLAACAATLVLPLAWRSTVVVPVVVASGQLLLLVLDLVGRSTNGLFELTTWSSTPFDRIPGTGTYWQLPLLLAPAFLGILVGGLLVTRMLVEADPRAAAVPILAVAGSSLVLLPGLYAAPLVLAVAALLVAHAVQVVLVLRAGNGRTRGTALVLAVASAYTVLGTALTSDVLTAVVSGLFVALTFALSRAVTGTGRVAGEALLAPLLAGCAWTLLHLVGLGEDLRVPVVLVLIGTWAILRPTWWTELAVLLTGLTVASLGLTASGPVDPTWLAVDLTVSGALVIASALVNPQRRTLGWFGLVLLTLAQWVRLEEFGVATPEAYTLPLGVALLVVGMVRMRVARLSSTRALTSGLVLALAPSLLIALAEPISLRAVLLGLGCAAAIALGAVMRWSAPLMAGAVVGSVLVLREATYAQVLPQWVTLALVGVVLTVIGATWERRVTELRTATGFVRRLR